MNTNTLVNAALLPVMMLLILLDLDGGHHTLISLYILGINLLAVYRARKNLYIMLTCTMLTYMHYCIIFKYYITDYSKLNGFFAPHGDVTITMIIILCLFSYGILLAVPKIDDDAPPVKLITEDCRDNPYIVVAMIALILVCIFGTYVMPTPGGARTEMNGWFANVGKFLLLTLYYSGDRKIVKRIVTLLLLVYCVKYVIAGARLHAVTAMISVYLALYVKKIKMRTLILPSMLLIILFRGIVIYRTRLFYMDNVAWALAEATIEDKFIVDTPLGGWWAAQSFIHALNFDGWETRLTMFGRWLINVPRTHEGPEASLTLYTQKYKSNSGGGMYEYYFYYWLGVVGLIIAILILHFVFRMMKKAVYSDSGLLRLLAIYYAGSVVVWYLYSPSGIFRAGGVMAIGYFLLDFGHRFMKGAVHRTAKT